MQSKVIVSSANPTYKSLLKLVKNKERATYILIEGLDLVEEADKTGHLECIIAYDENKISPLYRSRKTILLSRELYRNLSSYQTLPDIMGVASFKTENEIEGDRIIYLDGVQDPGNIGTIIRTALAFSFDSVVLSPNCASPYNSKVVQATKGAIFHLPIVTKNLTTFERIKDYEVIGTSLSGEDISTFEPTAGKLILVFGSEGRGMSEEILALCDKLLLLPINNIDSLNVGVAAGIFMFYYRRSK